MVIILFCLYLRSESVIRCYAFSASLSTHIYMYVHQCQRVYKPERYFYSLTGECFLILHPNLIYLTQNMHNFIKVETLKYTSEGY